jgi:alkylation response protein AidB-like acyl-CoA dehydrogenase
MSDYKAPLRDMQFVLGDLLDSESHYASIKSPEALTPDLLSAVLDNMAQFSEEVLAPINQSGDEEGCKWSPEGVTTPEGFKEAYNQYVEGGWPGLAVHTEDGGQGLPPSIGLYVDEMVGGANWSWSMYPGLSRAAVRLLAEDGTPEQKQLYLGKMVAGTWTGTMGLTEPQAGSDVGLLKTKAVPNADGSYSITGTKIFISAGEHDLSENIIHLVLARLQGAPQGTKGISLFIVPKFNVNDDGSIGDRNAVHCGSIEKKMGIKASATAVLNFDDAKGFLIGKENEGLNSMFIMMNAARVGTAMQGLCMAEAGLQRSVEYARERLQMRSLSGPKNSDGPADAIIVHPDVRRMLLTQKAIVEGSRAFLYWLIMQVDKDVYGDEAQKKNADIALSLLTPVAKAFITEAGLESANLALQCFGGHGYIKEHGVEQIVRDARIATVYEGTTGIQALDLIGRKILGTGGESLKSFSKVLHNYCEQHKDNAGIADMIKRLAELNKEWGDLTMVIGAGAMENPDEVGAASVDYLMYSGYVVLAWFWAQMAEVAQRKLDAGEGDANFYTAKLQTARFYYDRILPRTLTHAAGITAGAESTMAMTAENFYIA